jgi:hypothetical protein
MDEEFKEIVKQQWEARKKTKKLLPYVLLNIHGTGKIIDFRDA